MPGSDVIPLREIITKGSDACVSLLGQTGSGFQNFQKGFPTAVNFLHGVSADADILETAGGIDNNDRPRFYFPANSSD